jgi:hypothetical protein
MNADLTHVRAQHHIADLQRQSHAAAEGRRRLAAASSVKQGPARRARERRDGVMAMLLAVLASAVSPAGSASRSTHGS